jgi:hypothetical protein
MSWTWTVPQLLFFIFFATHIPITLLIDFQAILPQKLYPKPLVDLVDWYATEWGDPFFPLSSPDRVGRTHYEDMWFRSIIYCELFVQFPFFFLAVYAFWNGGNWIRCPAIAYGGHVATTVLVIVAEFLWNPQFHIPHNNLVWLVSVNTPYFVFPFWLMVHDLSKSFCK